MLRTILRHRDLTVLVACSMLLGLAYSFVIPFMSMFGTLEVGMSSLAFGTFMTVTSLASIVLSTWLARWSDTRFSRKALLLVGAGAGTLGYVGYALVREVWLLTLIGSLVLGVSSIMFSQVFALGRDVLGRSDVPASEAPLYMNVIRSAFALSWTFGPALAAWVMQGHSYRGTFFAAALLCALFLVVVLAFVPRLPPSALTHTSVLQVPLRQALRSPGLLAHFVGFTLYFSCSTMAMMNLPLLVLNTLHGTQAEVGLVYSIAPVFELPLMFYLGWLATRADQARLIRGAFGIAVVYYAGLALVGAPWHVYPLQLLSAAVVAVTQGVAITFFQNFLPGQAGTATNIYSSASRIGATAGYLLFGAFTEQVGHRGVFLLCALVSSLGLGVLVAFRPRAARVVA